MTTTTNLALDKIEDGATNLGTNSWMKRFRDNLDKLDAAIVNRAGGSTIAGTFFWRGANDNSAIIAKPSGDGRAGVFDLIHNDSVGYIFHLVLSSGADHAASAAIALGVDIDGIGLL